MALAWGKPKVEIGKIESNGVPFMWQELPEIEKDSAHLVVEQGEKTDATEEGGGVIDSIRKKNKFTFEFVLFVKKGDKKPIEDDDGIILENYAVRLTPENPTTEGFSMGKTIVNCEETWSSAEGKKLKYTFSGLTSVSGKVLKPYPPLKTFRLFNGKYLKLIKINKNSVFRFLTKN